MLLSWLRVTSWVICSGSHNANYDNKINAQMFGIVKQYDLDSLKQLVNKKYKMVIPNKWNTATYVASLKLLFENTPESDWSIRYTVIGIAEPMQVHW